MKKCIGNSVLYVGPEYRNHRGGIGAVLNGYSNLIYPFFFYPTHKSFSKIFLLVYSIQQLILFPFFLLFHRGIKIVHIHGASNGSFYRKYFIFIISKYLFRKKVIYHIHGGGFNEFYQHSFVIIHKMINHFLSRADIIICLSQSWYQYYKNEFSIKRLEIVPNFVNLPGKKLDFDSQKGKIIILFLGKIVSDKGVYDLLEVAIELNKIKEDEFEIWVGGNGETDKFTQLITKNGLSNCVKYIGWISGTAKEKILSETDIYILPSYYEGMPVSILEAMSYGIPVISTDVGGIPELIEDRLSGILIKPGDKKKLLLSIIELMENPDIAVKMGKRSYEIILTKFTSEVILNKLERIYSDLLIGRIPI